MIKINSNIKNRRGSNKKSTFDMYLNFRYCYIYSFYLICIVSLAIKNSVEMKKHFRQGSRAVKTSNSVIITAYFKKHDFFFFLVSLKDFYTFGKGGI